jgi:predicted nucleic acid-binding protein
LTLVDTSVWVEFFRGASRARPLAGLLEGNEVLLHPWVLGELALGGLGPKRAAVIADLRRLPAVDRVAEEEVLELVSGRRLWGLGIGWVDVHLLASALVAGCRLWTFDRSLAATAESLGLSTAP